MEDLAHSTPLPILLGRPCMKTAQTKIDVANGALTMEFDGDTINFNVSESVKYPNDVHSCFFINVIEKGIRVNHTGQATALKESKVERTTSEIVNSVATFESSSQYIGEPPIPIPISISTNRLLPSLVQVPN
ncbi:hypothetical protein COP2_007254 [Malus domestica]